MIERCKSKTIFFAFKTLFHSLSLTMVLIWQPLAYGYDDSIRLECSRVGYQKNQHIESWVISKSIGAVSRVREKPAQPRMIETTNMLDIKILAKEIRGWDPASNSKFQILLEDNLIILEGYFLDCLRE